MSGQGAPHPTPRSRRRRALFLASGSIVLASTCGVALAGAVSAGSGTDGPVPPASEAPPANSVEPTLSAAFALLRRTQTQADAIPASTVAFSQASGANPLLARRVSDGQGAEAWLVPGNATACILARVPRYGIGGAVCMPVSSARAGQLDVQSASSQLPGSELVAGAMPDGVESVTLHLADGSSVEAAVREDTYLALVRGAVNSITASGPEGPIATEGMSASSASLRFAR